MAGSVPAAGVASVARLYICRASDECGMLHQHSVQVMVAVTIWNAHAVKVPLFCRLPQSLSHMSGGQPA